MSFVAFPPPLTAALDLDETTLRSEVAAAKAVLGRAPRLAVVASETDAALAQGWQEVAESVGVEVIRRQWSTGASLGAERTAALEGLPDGFPDRDAAVRGLEAMRRYQELHGHADVPRGYRERNSEFALGVWMHEQRIAPVRRLLESLAGEVDGIAVTPGMPPRLTRGQVGELVPLERDVVAANPTWVGRLAAGLPAVRPPVPVAVLRFARQQNVQIAGEHVVVVCDDHEFGVEMACVLRMALASVTVCGPRHAAGFVDGAAMVVWNSSASVPAVVVESTVLLVMLAERGEAASGLGRMVAELVAFNTVLVARLRAEPQGVEV